MNWSNAKPWAAAAARLLLGAVWIWSSIAKLHNPLQFVQAVRAYEMTPEWLSKAIGYGLPVLELCLGIVLVLGIMVRIAAAVSGLLFAVFLIGIVTAAARGLKIDCGCFGGGGSTLSTSYTLDVLRDVALLAVAVYLVIFSMSRLSIEWYLARHDYVEPPSAKRMRTPEGRRRYESQVAQARSAARSRTLYVDASIAIVVVLIAVIGIGVQANRAKISNVVAGTNASATNGIVFGKKSAATVDVYEDFGCPVCREFENATHIQLEKDVRANLAQVRYHPISILDGSSPNQYSTRAANAAICVSDAGVDDFVKFHDLLYGTSGGKQVQPAEGTAGPGDTTLIELAKQAGLTTAQATTASTCITSQQYKPLVKKLTDNASKRGVSGTPTIYVNGRKVSQASLAAMTSGLFDAIAAADKGFTPSPSVTPSSASFVPSTGASSASKSPASSAPGSAASGSSPAPSASATRTP